MEKGPQQTSPPEQPNTPTLAESIQDADGCRHSNVRQELLEATKTAPMQIAKKMAVGVGRVKRSQKRRFECQYCLRWFSAKEIMRHFKACKLSASERCVECPYCNLTFQALLVNDHVVAAHPEKRYTPKQKPAARNVYETKVTAEEKKPDEEERIVCKLCQLRIRKSAMEQHMVSFHSRGKEWIPQSAARKFSFVLLPPSQDGLRNVIEQYRRTSKAAHHSLFDAQFNWERLEQIDTFHPIAHYVGTKSWKGYVVFEFQHSDKVVLECPRTGNATYILKGNWRTMIAATKWELRTEFRHLVTRVVHISDWAYRVRHAVFGTGYVPVVAVVNR